MKEKSHEVSHEDGFPCSFKYSSKNGDNHKSESGRDVVEEANESERRRKEEKSRNEERRIVHRRQAGRKEDERDQDLLERARVEDYSINERGEVTALYLQREERTESIEKKPREEICSADHQDA